MRDRTVGLAREEILAAIRDQAGSSGSASLGKKAFTAATGITEYHWTQHWARWSDAVAEAGLRANTMNNRYGTEQVLRPVAALAAKLGRLPTVADQRVASHADAAFPSKNTISNHFGGQRGLLEALRSFCDTHDEFSHLLDALPVPAAVPAPAGEPTSARRDGWVYLLKSGEHYKIGRSDELERRVKAISIALPEAVSLVHAIRTDDPGGIEAYWHRRFADKRANGEWFRLERADVAAFSRRKFQ